jgi:beta-galactosidase
MPSWLRTVVAALAACASLLSGAPAAAPANPPEPGRVTQSFDPGWRFLKGDAPGAEQPDFADAAWRAVDVPHDWSIEGPFDEQAPTGGDGGFLPSGIGWYRKCFALPAGDAARRVFIEFDGVMANSEVWINGHSLGRRPSGYVSFRYELTGQLNFGPGPTNLLAVRTDTSGQPASRWYAGAGIYRHVRLVTTNPIHLEAGSTFVTTPQISDAEARISVQTIVRNDTAAAIAATVATRCIDPAGAIVATVSAPVQLPPQATVNVTYYVSLPQPQRWELAAPRLYRAVTRVLVGADATDEETVTFGLREAHFEPATGFWLNGKNFKLQGVCLHQDGGAFGVAVPLGVWEQRLTELKKLGVNALRTAHNAVAPEFLDLCDRMGFLVMDEFFDAWTVAKRPYDYARYFNEWALIDARDTIRRDRNHPAIVLYSAGNEIHDTPRPELAKRALRSLLDVYHREDPTRAVTQALFRPNRSHDYDNGLADLLDVVGQNYRESEILAAYHQKPTRKILGTENGHNLRVWLACRDHPFYSGQFLWSGIDYLGESRRWPMIAYGSGLLDRTGIPKARAFERQSWWSDRPMVAIVRRTGADRPPETDPGYEDPAAPTAPLARPTVLADWTPKDFAPHEEDVEVYSNGERVELFLNGRSLGAQPRHADDSPRSWKVAFAPGSLKAVAQNAGQIVATAELRTAGPPARLALTVDRAQLAPIWDDVARVEVSVVDEQGVLVPDAADEISFAVAGPGVIAAVDNGDNSSHELFQSTGRKAYQGRCFAFVKATAAPGRMTLAASAPGLAGASVALETIGTVRK